MADNEFLTGYLSAQGENRGGLFGGEGIWGFLIFAMLVGGIGNGGWGWGGGGGAGIQGMVTRADINEGFALNNITGGITAIQQGIADSTYALNNTLMNGFHGVDRGLCDLSHQLSDCCCENRAAIAQVRYDMANQTRDVIEAGNANTRAILDFLTNDKIDQLRSENQALRFQASQTAQNAFITANQEAQTAELIRRIAPMPVPSYQVPAPYPYCGNAQYGYGYGGCGCAV